MQKLVVTLDIAAEEFVALYQGVAKDVLTSSADGRRVRFPGAVLRKFVTAEGVQGRFQIAFSEENRFVSIERLS